MTVSSFTSVSSLLWFKNAFNEFNFFWHLRSPNPQALESEGTGEGEAVKSLNHLA